MQLIAEFRVYTHIRSMNGFNMKNWTKVLAILSVFSTVAISAQESNGVLALEKNSFEVAKKKIETTLKMSVSSVANAPVDGILQVMTNRGIFYISEDAKYLLQGNIYNIDNGIVNETEGALSAIRKDGLHDFDGSFIEFKAKDEKYAISIFTDITCGYCRKLHKEIEDYNDLGITVRYLAFPRGGLGSTSYQDLVSIWCAEDPQEAMTSAKDGNKVEPKSCETNVEEQFLFAQKVGVSSTPAIVFEDGSLQPGYRPAAQMAQILSAM